MKTDTYKIQIKKNNNDWVDTGYWLPQGEYSKISACKKVRESMESVGEFNHEDTVKFKAVAQSI